MTMRGKLVTCAAAAALFLLVPGVSEAQVRIGVGVGVGRGAGFYGAPYGRGYYPGYGGYRGLYPGYPGYGRSGVSIGLGLGSYPYSYSGYGYSGLYAMPYYTPYLGVPRYSTGYVPYYTGSSAAYIVQTPPAAAPAAAPPAQVDNTAQIEIRVPAAARVWFDGAETKQTGPQRRFASPPLEPGYDYTYRVKATWTEAGNPVTQERKVVVQAGGQYQVDLTGEALPAPTKTQP